MDCWVTGRCAAKLIGGRGLFDGSSIDFSSDANSVNESSRIKHYAYMHIHRYLCIYIGISKTRVRQNIIQTRCDPAMKSCSRSTVYVTVSGQGLVDMFPRNCTNTCHAYGSGSGLLVNTIYYNVSSNAYTCNDYDTGRPTVTRE